jgi:cation transport protein ChaC
MWVFGYGSLLWNPGFEVAETTPARLHGYHRSFSMRSIHHRGTVENPGLVLALDEEEGAFCDGLALRVDATQAQDTLEYLRDRELVSSAYLEKDLEIALQDGRVVTAVTYVIDAAHEQYCGGLPLEEQAQIIAAAVGGRGENTEYLYRTVDHLMTLDIRDGDLEWLSDRVKAIKAQV